MGSVMPHDLDPRFLPLLWIKGIDSRSHSEQPQSSSSTSETNDQATSEPDSSPYSPWIRPQMAYELYQEQKKREEEIK